MKLKMRFNKDDMIKFGIYAFVLFIMIAVLVANLIRFANTGQLAGFNFFIALSREYILTTLVIYLLSFLIFLARAQARCSGSGRRARPRGNRRPFCRPCGA